RLGLVLKAGCWYLVAAAEGDVRVYRVSRILEVNITEEHAERPRRFDLRAFWSTWLAEFEASRPAYPAVVRVSGDGWRRIRGFGDAFHRAVQEPASGPDGDGW